jgi:glycosyltransferase involved in cell wall biosynthesis
MTSDSRLPRVSVGLPVYNGERYLREALGSLLGQTFGDLELIVSDNASTDGTEQICREYAAADPRVRYVRQPRNIGANANYNEVIRMSRAPFVKWSAHDDVCAPDYLEHAVALLDGDEDAVLSHSLTSYIDEDGRPLTSDGTGFRNPDGEHFDEPDPPLAARSLRSRSPHVRLRDVLLRTRWCFEVFGLMRRDALMRTPLLQRFYGTDKVLLAEAALLGTWQAVDEPLWFRRCHPGASTHMSVRQKATWSDPDARRTVLLPPVARMVRGYVDAIERQEFPPAERLQCYRALAVLAVQPDKFRKLLLPGPYNYFGIGNRPPVAARL